jgi:hypothetical protein
MAEATDTYVIVTKDVTEEIYFEGDKKKERPSKLLIFTKGQVAFKGEVEAAEARGLRVPTKKAPDDPNVRPGAIFPIGADKDAPAAKATPAAAGEAEKAAAPHKRPAPRRST